MNTNLFCPIHRTREMEWLSTTNEWRNYCRECDMRYNDEGQPMVGKAWITDAAEEIGSHFTFGSGRDSYVTDEQRKIIAANIAIIIERHCPFKKDVAYTEVKEPPLLQCVDCNNTESCAGAMARYFNHGRCLHCGGYFKVIRA